MADEKNTVIADNNASLDNNNEILKGGGGDEELKDFGGHFYGQPLEELYAAYQSQMDALRSKFSDQGVEDIELFRFLSGHAFNVQECETLITESLQWRKDKNMDEIKAKAITMDQMQWPHAEKIFKYMPHVISFGYTRDGAPVSLDRSGMIDPQGMVDNVTLEELEEYTFYHLENKKHYLNELSKKTGKLVLGYKIIDLTGLGMKHINMKALGMMRHMMHSGQANYPEMLEKMIIVNAPSVFAAVWKYIKIMMHARTQSKIVICGSDYRESLLKHIPLDQIPTWLDGARSAQDLFAETSDKKGFFLQNVGARSVKEKTFELEREGKVTWEFDSSAKDLEYDFEVIWKSDSETKSLMSMKKAKGSQKGEFVSSSKGALVLKLDNTSYMLKSKDYLYKVKFY